MRFSILVPVYKVEKYLLSCLESISQQTYKNYEVILVDDGSPDNSGIICDDYARKDCRFKVIHKKNEGLVSARREGIKKAKGDYCIFCDSDDFLEINALEKLNGIIENYFPDLIIYKGYEYDGKNKKPFIEPNLKQGIVENKKLIYDHFFLDYSLNPLCFKAVKRTIIDKEKDYSNFYKSNLGEDLLQSVPLVKNAKTIFYLDEYLYNYRNGSGMMHSYNPKYYWEYKAVNEENSKIFKDQHIDEYNIKYSYYTLISAYGAIMQSKYLKKTNKDDLLSISKDDTFRTSYDIVNESRFKNKFSKKQRIILNGLYNRRFMTIKLALALARLKNALERFNIWKKY